MYISSASGLFPATHTNPKCFFGYVDDTPGDIPSDWINQPNADQLRKDPGSAVKKTRIQNDKKKHDWINNSNYQ